MAFVKPTSRAVNTSVINVIMLVSTGFHFSWSKLLLVFGMGHTQQVPWLSHYIPSLDRNACESHLGKSRPSLYQCGLFGCMSLSSCIKPMALMIECVFCFTETRRSR